MNLRHWQLLNVNKRRADGLICWNKGDEVMSKVTQLQQLLAEQGLDAILITNEFNRRYITGFTGTSGVALVTPEDAILITDFRYIEQATEQAPGFNIIEHTRAIEQEVANQLKRLDIQKLVFEKEHVTYDQYEKFKQLFPCELLPKAGLIEQLRMIKSADEIEILKQAAKIVDDAFHHIQSYIKPGVRELDIANELEYYMRRQGATSSSFDTIVASGYRSSLPHGVASEKKIAEGELVTLDYGAYYKGYCSDITRTVAVGPIRDELKNIYQIVLEAQTLAVEKIKPGMTGKEADSIARNYINDKGYGPNFGHSTGHGIGLEIHEEPRLSIHSDIILKPGMVVTVEPGIYLPNIGGCRIEDDIVITETGNERLTFAPKELIYVS